MDNLWIIYGSGWWWYTNPSEKYELVKWDDYSQYMENTCSKPLWLHTVKKASRGFLQWGYQFQSSILEFGIFHEMNYKPSLFGDTVITLTFMETPIWWFPRMGYPKMVA